MGRLDRRVVIVTGAGRGLGRAHALDLAARGAAVVVNDVGHSLDGAAEAGGPSLAEQVVAEIEAAGGRAVASAHDVADWAQAEALVATAIDAFGELHALINNAGILRDQTLANLEEHNWDEVIRVHLKGHVAPTRHAVAHWRRRAKAGALLKPAVVYTTSVAGFCGNFGQAAYSAAKAAVLALSKVTAIEGAAYGIRSNAVSPSARTRFTMTMPGADERLRRPDDETQFDWFAPENVSPLFSWLVDADCPANGQVFHAGGNRIFVVSIPVIEHVLEHDGRWTLEALDERLTRQLAEPAGIHDFLRRDDIEATLS
jgi:NAD(P)-dependent dehydrogenase (short-subunit alcohol dehydrogenase family)